MTKKNLQSGTNASLYTSEIFDDGTETASGNPLESSDMGLDLGGALSSSSKIYDDTYGGENKFPDLLDLPKFTNDSQNYYENYFNMYSTLPITKTINSTNYYASKDHLKNMNCDDSQASLLSTSSNEKIIPSCLSSKKSRIRRYSIDSYSHIPSSSNSSSSFSLMTTTTQSINKPLYGYKQRSSSYLNLVSPETKYLKTNPYPSLPSSPNRSKTKENSTSSSIDPNSATKPLRIPSTATPLLDFSSFPIHSRITASTVEHPSQSSKLLYDYHATQLEYFIQEYRKLQDQLKLIGNLQLASPSTSSTSSSVALSTKSKRDNLPKVTQIDGQSAKFADPLMYNDAWVSADLASNDLDLKFKQSDTTNPLINQSNNIGAVGIGSSSGNSGCVMGGGGASSSSGIGNSSLVSGGGSLSGGMRLPTSTTSILKKKQLVNWNKSPDPPPYWLHRNAMIKQLNNNTHHHQQQQQSHHHQLHNINNNNSSNNNNSNRNNGAPSNS